jgi:6-phosphofructokinase 1
MHVALLTGGGDCAGLDTVVRTLTLSLLNRQIQVTGIEQGYAGLMRHQWRALSFSEVQTLSDVGGSLLGCHNRANPFADPDHDGTDVSAQVLAWARERRIDGVVAIGGDGTLSIAARLHAMGLPHLVVPKTIDNDLAGTQGCVGFDTAVSVVTEALQRLRTTARSHGRVLILHTMGRNTGWLALYAGIAAPADVILLPELPIVQQHIVDLCRQRGASPGLGHTIICAAEAVDVEALREALAQALPCEVRSVRLGHVQRGGPPTATDRLLATHLAHAAAQDAAARRFGYLIGWQGGRCRRVAFNSRHQWTRKVPTGHPLVQAAADLGVSLGQ